MKRALELALKNSQGARPNPSVGAVIVSENRVIGEGFTSNYGGNHAEINALKQIRKEDLPVLSKAILYVTLEPCSHTGKTPPCSLAIIQSGISKVVIGCQDPNPLVSGKGITLLKASNIEVTTGVLEKECAEAHRQFLTFINHKRPYITLKWAASKDEFIAPLKDQQSKPGSYWLSHPLSKQWTHKLRANSMGIVIGAETLRYDQPSLNTRIWAGKDPEILIIGGKLSDIPRDWLNKQVSITQFTKTPEKRSLGIYQIAIEDSRETINSLVNHCIEYQIQTLLVEGGSQVINQFLECNLWDETIIFKCNSNLKEGVKAPRIDQKPLKIMNSAGDKVIIHRNRAKQ
jgi:diaminohydroxyphosphoribosylaminopyrimidine deaminase/5-amino-6-(5-phosphoribosylamino)uracil reductase